ncbi:MAG: ribonuclease HII [Candidatus Nanoarchaeia archaeon]
MKICGIDEAGRGPVIGPLVICAYCLEEENLVKLQKLKIKESKQLTPTKRANFYKKLITLSKDFCCAIVSANEIDLRASKGLNINELEALKIANLLDTLKPDVAYIDSPISPDGAKFSSMIERFLEHKKTKLIAEHYADVKYLIVAAASIIAKVTRDREIEKIKKELGVDFGSGYPADPITMKFLKENWKNPNVSKYIRKSWGTIQDLKSFNNQKTLSDFENKCERA